MKTKKILFILLCVLSAVLFSANTDAVAAEHEFSLIVQKGLADPIVNVNCYVFNESGAYLSISGTTDENGHVSFDLSEGAYRIRVDYLGYQFWTEVYDVPEALSDEFTIDHQDVNITIEGTFQGSSDPIEGIKVYLFTASGSYVSRSQVTDPGGQATFNLPEQSYKVRTDYLGQQFWSETFTWQDTTVSIPMADAEITVTGAGLPQEGVNVYVFSGSGSYLSVSGTTDTEGKVLFRLVAGTYKFRADYEGSHYWSGEETLIADQVNPIAISAGGGLFNLTVLKGAADPLAGVNCYVFNEGGSYLSISGTTDENGQVFFDLSEGAYRIRVDYLGYQFWTEVYDVPEALSDEFTIDHQDVNITIEGTFQGSSDPIEGIKVYLFTASGSYVSRSQVTDPGGQATFNLPEQSYKVRADFLGQQFWSETFTWQDTTVNIPMADAEITVTGAGLPQEGVNVYVFSGSGSYLSVSGTTDTEGKVLFRLAAGTYKFRADYEGSHYWSGQETLIADQVNSISVSAGGGLFNLTVLKGAADPLAGVNCYVFNEGGSYLSISGTTDGNGQISFDLSEGTYRIRVDYLGYQFWTEFYDVPTTLSGEFIIAHQDVLITVEGIFQGSSDLIEGIKVYLFTASGSYVSRSQVTDPGGQVTFRLPEQSYKVRADFLGQQFWSETFTWQDKAIVIQHGMAHVHVTRSGADLDGANVYLFTESGSYLSRFQTTDTSGLVEFLISAGSYKFRADQGGEQRWSAVTPITADLVTDVEIEMEEFPPTVSIVEPDGVDDIADISYIIKWTDDDPDNNATISLFYDNDDAEADGTLIVSGLSEDPDGAGNDEYLWDTSAITDGSYYVYAVIDDGQNDPVVDYSEGVVTIDHTSSIPGEVKLTASDAEADDWFGYWADIDRDYVIVGSPWEDENGEDSGAAYIFKRNENAWIEQAKLTAGDAKEGDLFGISVSIDGDYAIVGAGGDENDKGAAYVFRFEGMTWVEQTKLTADDAEEGDSFGSSVSICGEYAVIGAYYANDGMGAAYIFKLDGDTWTEQAKLTASDAGGMGFFGVSVSICGEYAVIGSPYGNYFFGAAYVFKLDGDTWTEQAKLTAIDAQEWGLFGSSVSIDGDYVIVGAGSDENEKGAAYIFRLEGAAWSEQTKLTVSDGEEYDSFGIPVAINAPYVIVGASGNDEKGTDSGAAYIYQIEGWEPAPEISVSAIPENILLGESSTLAWDSTNADSVTIDQGIGTVDLDGTISVFPIETTTYTVTATGTGSTATDSVTVYVVNPDVPPTVDISTTQGIIEQGDATTLTWTATNASTVSIDQGIGDVPMSGSVTVSPNETTTYTITATNPAGTDTDSVTIYVIDPNVLPTASISAAPVGIELGASSTLIWTATNASTVSIDHGIGEVPMSGSITVSPNETTIYTVTATNPAGTDTDSVSVYIIDPDVPPTVNMSATPTTIVQGLDSTLTWTATNAASVSIDHGIGEVPMGGSLTIYPEETTTYTITVTNPAGTDTDSVSIKVYGPSDLPVVSMSATPQTISREDHHPRSLGRPVTRKASTSTMALVPYPRTDRQSFLRLTRPPIR